MKIKFAVIGVGNMAGAIIDGMLSSDEFLNTEFFLCDKSTYNCERFVSRGNFNITDSVADAVKSADYVLLSVKPQNFSEILEEICCVTGHEKKIYITIAAGITVASLETALNGAVVIRVLPNIPMTIGKGVSAICKNKRASARDFELVKAIFVAAGSMIVIDEVDMNKIIGVTSSSPAYVFKFIDAICKAASAQGLDGEALLGAVCDVVIGSALLLKNSSDAPSLLIQKVASKGGTTEQALIELDNGKFEAIIESAMRACTTRADELGKK